MRGFLARGVVRTRCWQFSSWRGRLGALIEVVYNRGLYLPEAGLWLDPRDAQEQAFVSHAHADHFARHGQVICSRATAGLLQARYRVAAERLVPVDFQLPVEINGHTLQLLPAGHVFGSAMLHVTSRETGRSLLYTGDFKLRRSRTAEPVLLKAADTLVMETTFGLPRYVFPSALEVEGALLRFVHEALDDGDVPVLLAYALGKAQEAHALLAEHGIEVLVHPSVAAMHHACRAAGCEVPEPRVYQEGDAPPGARQVLIAPPNVLRSKWLAGLGRARTAVLSGWALDPSASFRYRCDAAIPLSDHADYPALLETVRRVRPKRVLTLHGFAREFAAELRQLGLDAWSVFGDDQLEMAFDGPRRAAGRAAQHPRPGCGLASFTDVCQNLGSTNSRVEKVNHLAWYLRNLPEGDLGLAIRWLSGAPLAARQTTSLLERALLSLPGAAEARYRAHLAEHREMAKCVRLTMEELVLRPAAVELAELDEWLAALHTTSAPTERLAQLSARLATLHPREAETLVRLLGGELKLGITSSLLEEALAAALDLGVAELRSRQRAAGDLAAVAVAALGGEVEPERIVPLVPQRLMRGLRAASAAAVFQQLGVAPGECVWVEECFDGRRAQLHKRGGEVALFGSRQEPLGQPFPELLGAARQLPSDVVLDGQIVAWAGGNQLGRGWLEKRRAQHGGQVDLFAPCDDGAVQVVFIAFDLLWWNGSAMLAEPLCDRRGRLERLGMPEPLRLGEVQQVASAAELAELCGWARARGSLGVVAKDPWGPYTPGRRADSWLELRG